MAKKTVSDYGKFTVTIKQNKSRKKNKKTSDNEKITHIEEKIDQKSVVVGFRITDDERHRLRGIAHEHRTTLNDILRTFAHAVLDGDLNIEMNTGKVSIVPAEKKK